jgi:hypothetical protein
MKKQISTPVIIGSAVLLIFLLGFAFLKLTGSGPEIPEQPRAKNYQEGMPDYIKNAGQPGNTVPGAPGQPGEIPKGADGKAPPGLPPEMAGAASGKPK